MPELPEVEVIRLGLEKKLVQATIQSVEVLNPKSFQGDASLIQNQTITAVWRRAKILGIDLKDGHTVLVHLKMSGQLVFIDSPNSERFIGGHPTLDMFGDLPNKSTRVIFTITRLGKTSYLYFNDQRKFGWVKVVQNSTLRLRSGREFKIQNFLKNLGPEPLDKDFTWQILRQQLQRHKNLPVKVALMDQAVLAGIGNIYASESLFLAHLDPRKKVSLLTDANYQNLASGIVQALKLSIKHGGSSRANFVNALGQKGYFLDFAFVYGKNGEPCKTCQTPIVKITQAGRGTYYCPKCQS